MKSVPLHKRPIFIYIPHLKSPNGLNTSVDCALAIRAGIWRSAQDSNLQTFRPTVFKTAPSPPGHTAYVWQGR